eukprot:COSAG02_NODE_1625_length_11593_cov_9.199930_2_plen_63_part_00
MRYSSAEASLRSTEQNGLAIGAVWELCGSCVGAVTDVYVGGVQGLGGGGGMGSVLEGMRVWR